MRSGTADDEKTIHMGIWEDGFRDRDRDRDRDNWGVSS
jgi:hypothetical protein